MQSLNCCGKANVVDTVARIFGGARALKSHARGFVKMARHRRTVAPSESSSRRFALSEEAAQLSELL